MRSLIKGKRINIFKINKKEQFISFDIWLKQSGGEFFDLKNLNYDNL